MEFIGNNKLKKLLNILVCPLCKEKLFFQKNIQELWCKKDYISFPIREEIPILLQEESRNLTKKEIDFLNS